MKFLLCIVRSTLTIFCLCGFRDVRLGRSGADEVKSHAWFRNDNWTWDNIRQYLPPVVPELNSDVDTQYFDVIDDEKEKPESFTTPRVSGSYENTTISHDLGDVQCSCVWKQCFCV